jgi:hypothetical protein
VTGFDFVHALFVEYSDVIRTAAYLLLVIGAAKVFHINLGVLGPSIAKEMRELLKVKPTTGAANALGLLLIFIFGIYLVVADKFSVVLGAVSALLGAAKAKELVSGGAWIAFICLCVFAFVSLRSVERVEVATIRARQKK